MSSATKFRNRIKLGNVREFTGTGNVTILNEGMLLVNKATGAATTVTLPGNPDSGDMIIIKDAKGDAGTNNITLDAPGAATIEGMSNYIIASNYGGVWLLYDKINGDWSVVNTIRSQAGVGTPGNGITALEFGDGGIHHTMLLFDAYSLATTDNGTGGHGGGAKIYDFPQGAVLIVGASQNWELLTVDGTGLPDDVEIDLGVGTTVATSAMASLTGTTQDIVNKDDITFSTSLSALHQYIDTVSSGNKYAGEATAIDAYLNLAATVATADANGTLLLTGTISIHWLNLGKQSA